MPSVLTASQVQSYEEEGYIFPLPGLTAEQAAETVAHVRELERRHSDEGRDYVHRTLLRFKPHLLYPWLNEVIRAPRILDAVEDLIGPDIRVGVRAVHQRGP